MIHILTPHSSTGWVTAIIEGRWVEAKVYDLPSRYGINNSRVSKCAIGKTSTRNPNRPFSDQMDYQYDRGLEFDNLPEGLLDKILMELELLPV